MPKDYQKPIKDKKTNSNSEASSKRAESSQEIPINLKKSKFNYIE